MSKKKLSNYKVNVIIFLTISTIFLLIYSLGYEKALEPIKYFSYLYSSFSLVVVLCNIKRFYIYLKNKFLNTLFYNNTKKFLYRYKYIKMYFENIKFKNLINLCLSMIINFTFIFIKFIDGVNNKSLWFISLSIYYLLLTLVKLVLLSNLRKYNENKEFIIYRNVGYFIMLLNIVLVIMIIQMIRTNIAIIPKGYVIYATATYTFYLIISAIINVIKYKKYNSPMLSSIKIINLLTASVSILMLQTTMIATFGSNNFEYMKLMNTITGSAISVFTLGISTYMIIKSQKRLRI